MDQNLVNNFMGIPHKQGLKNHLSEHCKEIVFTCLELLEEEILFNHLTSEKIGYERGFSDLHNFNTYIYYVTPENYQEKILELKQHIFFQGNDGAEIDNQFSTLNLESDLKTLKSTWGIQSEVPDLIFKWCLSNPNYHTGIKTLDKETGKERLLSSMVVYSDGTLEQLDPYIVENYMNIPHKHGLKQHLSEHCTELVFTYLDSIEEEIIFNHITTEKFGFERGFSENDSFNTYIYPVTPENYQEKINELKKLINGMDDPDIDHQFSTLNLDSDLETLQSTWDVSETEGLNLIFKWSLSNSNYHTGIKIKDEISGKEKLVSWRVIYDDGCIGHLHTIPESRGKGYGFKVYYSIEEEIIFNHITTEKFGFERRFSGNDSFHTYIYPVTPENYQEKINELKKLINGMDDPDIDHQFSTLNLDSDLETLQSTWKFSKTEGPKLIFKWSLSNSNYHTGIKIKDEISGKEKLVAWRVIYDDGCIGHLHTIPESRGKGYGFKVYYPILVENYMNIPHKQGLQSLLSENCDKITIMCLGKLEEEILFNHITSKKFGFERGYSDNTIYNTYIYHVTPENVHEKIIELKKFINEKDGAEIDGEFSTLDPNDLQTLKSAWGVESDLPNLIFGWSISNPNFNSCIKIKDPETGIEKLAAWRIIYSNGCLGHLYTMPEFRRNGFGIKVYCHLLIKFLKLTKGNYCPFWFIKSENEVSIHLSSKIGAVQYLPPQWKPNEQSQKIICVAIKNL
eukprot:gene4917-6128_t